MKAMKRVLSGITALAMSMGLIGVPIGENWAAFFSNESTIIVSAESSDCSIPTLDSDSAAVFVAFLANDGTMSVDDIKSSLAYKLMTNTYDGEDKTAMMEGLYQYIMMSTSIRAGTSESNKSYLSNNVVNRYGHEILLE